MSKPAPNSTTFATGGCIPGSVASRRRYSDLATVMAVTSVVALFAFFPSVREVYAGLDHSHGIAMSFVKFAVLATFGEMLTLRLSEGVYVKPGFGLLPKAFVWGLLGIAIKAVFVVFAAGVPALLKYLAFDLTPGTAGITADRVIGAFSISLVMNLVFSPVLMVVHKMTDLHIAATNGAVSGFFTPMDCAGILKKINWDVMWHFVFKKTIPFFWLPAHTITFLLPAEMRIGFAALLGVALGGILAIAGRKK